MLTCTHINSRERLMAHWQLASSDKSPGTSNACRPASSTTFWVSCRHSKP